MSDQADALDGDDSPIIRQLRQQNKELSETVKTLQGQFESIRRSSVFDDLGIPKTGPAQFFREKYDGDLTPDAIRAAAQTYGLIAEPPPATPPDEQAMVERMFEPSATAPKAEASVSQQLLEQIGQADGNDEVDAILDRNGLLVIE